MAASDRLESARLTVHDSVIEFPAQEEPIIRAEAQITKKMEQMTGIEPACSAWEANILPLNYICKNENEKHPQTQALVFGAGNRDRTCTPYGTRS